MESRIMKHLYCTLSALFIVLALSVTSVMAEQCKKLSLEITGKLGRTPISLLDSQTDDVDGQILEIPLTLIDISNSTIHLRFRRERENSFILDVIPNITSGSGISDPESNTLRPNFHPLEFDDFGVQLADQSYLFSLDRLGVPNGNGSSIYIVVKSLTVKNADVHSLVTTASVEQVACEGFGDLDVHDQVNGGRPATVEYFVPGEGEKAMYEDWLRGQAILNVAR
jgi:hypothetical protein